MEDVKVLKGIISKYRALPVQLKASFWFLICGFLAKGMSVIVTPIFTRLLSSAEYGQFSVFNSWYGIISVIITLNLYCGVYSRGLVEFADRRKEYSSAMQGLCFTLFVVSCVVYILFYQFWNELFSLTTIQMVSMLLMIWLNAAFQFWAVSQRVDFRYKLLVAITMFVTIAQPILGIILVLLSEDKVTARIFGILIVEVVAYTGFFIVQMKQGKQFYSKKYWKQALLFNLPLVPHYLSMTVLNSADRIMIDDLVGSDKAGIYNLAYSISQIMIIFNTALLQTFEPWLYKKINAKKVEEISRVAIPSFVLVAAVNILLMFFAPEVVLIFAPKEYIEAIWIIPPVAMSVFFMYLYTFFAVFEFYYKKTNYVMIATTVGAVLNVVLNYIFIKQFGYFAAGYTTLACYCLFAIIHYMFMKKMCREYLNNAEPYNVKALLAIVVGFVVLGFGALFTYSNVGVRYSFLGLLFISLIIARKRIMRVLKELISIKTEKTSN